MLDSLLGRKFSNKCKHSVKCIRCRMETIRRKKLAMVRCLKKDVADLISTGHGGNAFGRMDALIYEINQASCYDLIEQYCCCILEHLPTMQKERECPKETMEAVATLIFAAAWFSDLPELADLRRGFTQRYETNMESCTNKEFVAKMQEKSFSHETKLQLMKDIAREFSIDWDANSFGHKVLNSFTLTNFSVDDRRAVTVKTNEQVDGNKTKAEEITYLKSDMQKRKIEFEKAKTAIINEENRRNIHTTPKNANSRLHRSSENTKKAVSDESENVKLPHFGRRAPPHTKTNGNENENCIQYQIHEENSLKISEIREGNASIGVVSRTNKTVNMLPPHAKFTPNFKGASSYQDCFVRSTAKGVVEENPASDRAPNLKPPYFKPNDNNTPLEVIYTKKGTSDEPWKPQKGSIEQSINNEQCSKLSAHTRSKTASLLITETVAGKHIRSVSMQPNLMSPNGGNVHPRLPDYDNLASRIAELRNS